MQVETHHGPFILISRSWVVRLSGVSSCDVRLGLGLEVSWKRVGMDLGAAQREGRGKEKPKKVDFENGLAVLVEKGFLSFNVSNPGYGVPPHKPESIFPWPHQESL